MNAERVQIEVADDVAQVRLVRADKHNALDWEMLVAINEAIDELGESTEVRAVVLSGDGPSFCSGLDFPSFMDGDTEVGDVLERRDGDSANFAQRTSHGWQQLAVPVIAAVHGAVFGGGLQIALGADIRIAAPDTKMSVMEMKYGLIPDMGITAVLPGLVRADTARELTYTGRKVEADEALELGLVTRIADDPRAAAAELAAEIASNSPDAVRAAKRLLRDTWRAPTEEGLALEAELQEQLIQNLQKAAPAQ
jgi:enoyl-CoA hydratase/carnithine racemase